MQHGVLVLGLLVALLSIQAFALTREVCASGCAFSTVSSALEAVEQGDVVHIHEGIYANEALNNTISVNITIRADKGATVVPKSNRLTPDVWMWLFVSKSQLVLEGDLTIILRSWTAGGGGQQWGALNIFYGEFIQRGNLRFLYEESVGSAVWSFSYWTQYGLLSVDVPADTDRAMIGVMVGGVWTLETGANVVLNLANASMGSPMGIFMLGGLVTQHGDIEVNVVGGSAIYYQGFENSPGWVQYGKIDMTLRDSRGIMMETGKWTGYGDVTINTDRPNAVLSCWRFSDMNVTGKVDVRHGDVCYTLAGPEICGIKPTECPRNKLLWSLKPPDVTDGNGQ